MHQLICCHAGPSCLLQKLPQVVLDRVLGLATICARPPIGFGASERIGIHIEYAVLHRPLFFLWRAASSVEHFAGVDVKIDESTRLGIFDS